MKTKMFAAVICALVLYAANFAQVSESLIGKAAPDLRFEKLINYEKTVASSADFKSKVLIIDFWATWCAPCIASFPHLEELQRKYAGKVQIITVTDETEERIGQFLTKKKVGLPIAFDAGGRLAAAFPYRTLPHTIIVDAQNVVQAVTTSAAVTDEVIDKILANQPVKLEEKKADLKFSAAQPLSARTDALYQMTLLPFQEGYPEGFVVTYNAGTSSYANRRILVTNAKLQALYETAYQYPTGVRTIIEAKDKTAFEWSQKSAYCYDLIVPSALGSERYSIMRRQLAEIFPYKPVIEKRAIKVKVLRRIENQSFAVQPSAGGKSRSMSSGEGLEMTNTPFAKVPSALQSILKAVVIDETGISGNYDLKIPYFMEDPERIYLELNKLGLELKDETREIEMLVIGDAS